MLLDKVNKANPKDLVIIINPYPDQWYEIINEIEYYNLNVLLLNRWPGLVSVISESKMNSLGWYRKNE